MKRTIIAVLAGAIAHFIWIMLSWIVIPVHTPSIKEMPQEDAVINVLRSTLNERGVYYFPWLSMENHNKPGAMDEWTQKYRSGPTGILVYDPAGNEPFSPGWMFLSFLFDVFAIGIGVWLFKRSTAEIEGYFARSTYFGVIGILLSVAVYLQEWIHLKFPPSYVLGFCSDQIVGWLVAGLVIAAILKPEPPAMEK